MRKKLLFATASIVVVLTILTYFSWSFNLFGSSTPPDDSKPHLIVDGLVQTSLNLTLEQIFALPKTTVNAELICVDFPNDVVAMGDWTGVRLGLILDWVGVHREAVKVAFYAEDGFSTDLTVAEAMEENIILAYERDGEPLQEVLRLVVPARWGYKWIRGVEQIHIELVDFDFTGFWESRGYSDKAYITTKP